MKGLSGLAMADSRAPSMIFGCLRPMHVCIPSSVSAGICAGGLEMAHAPGNEDALGKITRFHATLAAESTRVWPPFALY